MKLFTTPESRRKFGEVFWESDPDAAVAWIARAWLEENGKADEFQDAHDAWKAAEPREVGFMPASEALPLIARRDAAIAAANERWDAMWRPKPDSAA